ncbi:uncharacterized protein LOC116261886 isoform X1 [Nymphaea colorata]|nr:uncharacterized protein LOC116261886 isoform X1 [Nymphaea colorata]
MENKKGHDVHGSGGDGTSLKEPGKGEGPGKGDEADQGDGEEGLPESCVIDVRQEDAEGRSRDQGAADKEGQEEERGGDGERECRICHLGTEESQQSGQGGLIHLGCGCTDSLGFAHKRCAEAWFMTRGRKDCEICGLDAKNVTGVADWNFLIEWNEGRACPEDVPTSVPMWRRQPFCTILLLLVIICIVLLGVFHIGL